MTLAFGPRALDERRFAQIFRLFQDRTRDFDRVVQRKKVQGAAGRVGQGRETVSKLGPDAGIYDADQPAHHVIEQRRLLGLGKAMTRREQIGDPPHHLRLAAQILACDRSFELIDQTGCRLELPAWSVQAMRHAQSPSPGRGP
jgi:hypothetical protein